MRSYVHGYSVQEYSRLVNQAKTLSDLLHYDTIYPQGTTVLEAGCGVGAQTITLCQRNPQTHFTAIDISNDSINRAKERCREIPNVEFQQADIKELPFPENHFDHLFLCFVLEHLPHPEKSLHKLLKVVKPGGTVTIIEGDHGSPLFYPDSEAARSVINCQCILQKQKGGNSTLGRALFPLMQAVGLKNVLASPRLIYSDASLPNIIQHFTKETFIAMVTAVKEEALEQKLITPEIWKQGVEDLYKAADEGSFSYTFFKATATV